MAIVLLAAAAPAGAQDLQLEALSELGLTRTVVQILLLVTVLSLAPGILMMITCFPFIITVLAILRQGLGLQQAPPNALIVSLALFLTVYVMEPVFVAAWREGIEPALNSDADPVAAIQSGLAPFEAFMRSRVDEGTLARLGALRSEMGTSAGTSDATGGTADGLATLVPAFLLGELERAFQVGFLIFLPFLIIDLVVAAVLMSMGMMMVPPSVVSLPFKLAFFVVADGWTLISEALVRGYL